MSLQGGARLERVRIGVFDDGSETVVIMETGPDAIEPMRWSARHPTRTDACWLLESTGVLPPVIVDAIRVAEPCFGMVGTDGYVRNCKTVLRSYPMHPITPHN